jgi:hypothetical protein
MPGRLSLHLRLEHRQSDRIRVSVLLSPSREPVRVDGVAVELFDSDRESLSPRLLLPVSGTLCHPVASTVELRSTSGLPSGSIALATAWTDSGPIEATCPTEPCPDLHDHMRGRRTVRMSDDGVDSPDWRASMEGIADGERCRLARVFRWLTPPSACAPRILEDHSSLAQSICDDLGLDGDNAAFVQELLDEDA